MRKRPILLAAAALAAGLAVLGTVVAQQPGGGSPMGTPPSGGTIPPPATPTTRPYNEWTPTPPPPGYTPGQPGTIQQTSGILPPLPGYIPSMTVPAGGSALPAPRMDAAAPQTGAPMAPPAMLPQPAGPGLPIAPPSVSRDPIIPAIPALGTASPALPSVPPTQAPFGRVPGEIGPSLPPVPASSGPVAIPTPAMPGRVMHNLVLETVCPETVVYGQEFRYEIIVRNAGNVAVAGVRVDDEIPAGARYVGSDPPAELNGDRVSWVIGSIDANGEKRIAVRIKPSEEGEIRSRATVTYSATVDARTRVTRPRLSVAVAGSEVCRAGEEAVFQIKVANSGTGPAQRMILRATLSDGLLHPQGMVIEAELANLPPGESKSIPLKVSAAKSGLQECKITVVADGSPDATGTASVRVVEPMLKVAQSGPVKCHVRAEPTYEITLSNPGTAVTDPITLYTVLPENFEFSQANENGSYVAANRAVLWKLAGLPPGGSKTVSMKLKASAAGDGLLRTQAQAVPEAPVMPASAPARPTGRVLEAKTETAVKAEGVAAIKFEVCDLEDPVETGKEAVYEIRVTNQGTGVCTNVQLVAALAEGTTYTGSSGPTQIKVQGQHLVFEPIPSLAVKGEAVYHVRVRSTVAGDLRFRVQLTCDQIRTPVVKEESTSFYKE